jgi:dienelactone hydrolase
VGLLVRPVAERLVFGVLVAHEGPGISDHEREVARRLAALGYAAFALDYHGDGKRIDDRAEMFERLGVLMNDVDLTREIGLAGLAQLLAEPLVDHSRVAAIGYCFGGTMALELGRAGAPLAAIVGLHAGLVSLRPDDSRNINCPVLMCVGADDPIVPAEQRAAFEAEMRAAGVDWQLYVYGRAQHTFTNPAAIGANLPGIVYDAAADARSWRAMMGLLAETVGAGLR